LPQPENTDLVSSSAFEAPQTPNEKILAGIWAELLDLSMVGRNDNFFELGGDSIVSLRFISRAQSRGLYLTPRQVFEAQTIAALAQIAQQNNPVQAEQGLVLGNLPLTPIQHWFLKITGSTRIISTNLLSCMPNGS
jgi:aryl carrier-like protein